MRVVHGDIKPSNLFYNKNSIDGRMIMLIDFAFAQWIPDKEE